jgi:hypothetical protein
MLKRSVNGLTTIIYVIHVLSIAFLLGACTAVSSAPIQTWRVVRTISSRGPLPELGLWVDSSTAVLAAPGDLNKPDINLYILTSSAPPFVVGPTAAPRHVTVYPASFGQLQLLWLDQNALGDTLLMGAFLGPNGELQRGPAAISNRPTSDYSAVATPSGDLLVLWVEAGDHPTPLYAEVIDSAGRPRPPIQLARTARQPSAVYAPDGTLHVAWLELSAPRLWTIRYVTFPNGEPSAAESTPVGVINVMADEAVEGFGIGLDATHVYCLWSVVQVTGDPRGRLDGLTFPIGENAAVHPLSGAVPDGSSLRWPMLSARAGQALQIGLTMSIQTDGAWQDLPATATIAPGGIGPVRPLVEPGNGSRVLGKVAFASDDKGNNYAAWSTLRDDGRATIFYATNRP